MPVARRLLALHAAWTRTRDWAFSRAVRGAFGAFGEHTVVALPVRLQGAERIVLGSRVYVGAGSWLRVGGADPDARLEVGDGTRIVGDAVLTATRSVRLGRDVLVARGVHVGDHEHRHDPGGGPILAQGTTPPRAVVVGDGAWLGQGVVVLPGVTIGAGAVVGANAVVRDDVPPWSVAVGAPARVVATRPTALVA